MWVVRGVEAPENLFPLSTSKRHQVGPEAALWFACVLAQAHVRNLDNWNPPITSQPNITQGDQNNDRRKCENSNNA